MEPTQVRCMNCSRQVPAVECQLVFGVMVCQECGTVASTLYERGQSEIRTLLTLMKESIRIALIEGRLCFPTGETSKRDVLKTILHLTELRHERTAASVHGPARDRVHDTVPVAGVPWGGEGVPNTERALEGRDGRAVRPVGPDDRQVRDVQALHDDGGEGAGPSSTPGT